MLAPFPTVIALDENHGERAVVVRVLIVDDQASFRRAARNVVEFTDDFELAGEASTGEESVELARSVHPDLVLMDVHLPGIDGPEASRRILREGGNRHRPVILLFSAEPEVDPAICHGCGAISYVPKAEFGSERLLAAWCSASEGA